MGDAVQEFVEHFAHGAVQMRALATVAAEITAQRRAAIGTICRVGAVARRGMIERVRGQARGGERAGCFPNRFDRVGNVDSRLWLGCQPVVKCTAFASGQAATTLRRTGPGARLSCKKRRLKWRA
jgi:hypothetical protein